MKKFLINCSFNHYINGTVTTKANYALIINEPEANNPEATEHLVYDQLCKVFKMPPYKDGHHYNLTFTAQPI